MGFEFFGDSDCVDDLETRISVAGFVIYLLNVSVCWRSKGQQGVTTSTAEVEYVAILEATKEIVVIFCLLKNIGVQVNLPILVKTDNIGAIFMSENALIVVWTQHVNTRYHFIKKCIVDGLTKTNFIRLKENDSEIFMKNVNVETYQRHMKKCLGQFVSVKNN
jgi:hypothetical protein